MCRGGGVGWGGIYIKITWTALIMYLWPRCTRPNKSESLREQPEYSFFTVPQNWTPLSYMAYLWYVFLNYSPRIFFLAYVTLVPLAFCGSLNKPSLLLTQELSFGVFFACVPHIAHFLIPLMSLCSRKIPLAPCLK